MDAQQVEQLRELRTQHGEKVRPSHPHENAPRPQQQDQTQPALEQMRLSVEQPREQVGNEVREQQKVRPAIEEQQERPHGEVRELQQRKRQQQEVDGMKGKSKDQQARKLGQREDFGISHRKTKNMRHYRALRSKARETLEKHFGSMHVMNPIDPFPTAPRRETEVFLLEELPAGLTEKVAAEMSKQRKKRIQQRMVSRARSSPAVQAEEKGAVAESSARQRKMEEDKKIGVNKEKGDEKGEGVGDFNVSLPSSFFSSRGATFEAVKRSGGADVTGEFATATALRAGLEELQQEAAEKQQQQHLRGGEGDGLAEEARLRRAAAGDDFDAPSLISHVDRHLLSAAGAAAGEKTEGRAGDTRTVEGGRRDETIGASVGKDKLPFDVEKIEADVVAAEQQEKRQQQQEENQFKERKDIGDADVPMMEQETREGHDRSRGGARDEAGMWNGRVLEEGRKGDLFVVGKEEEEREKRNCCLRLSLALSSAFSKNQKGKKEESLFFSPRGGGGGDTCSVCTRRSRFSFFSRDERLPNSTLGSQAGGRYSGEGEKRRAGSSFYFLTRLFPAAEGSTPPMMAARLQATPCRINRFVLLAIYVLYALLTGRVYFAWPNISNLLFRSEAYLWLCEEGWEKQQQQQQAIVDMRLPQYGGRRYGCEEQNTRVQQLFIVCLACAYACALLAGLLLDKIGPKLTALFGQCCNCAAWLLLAAASRSAQTYFPAFVVMGVGVDSGYMALLSVANLFPGHEGLVVATLGSAKSLSFAMPTILDAIEASSSAIKLRDVSIAYAVVGPGLCAVIALFLVSFRPFLPWTSFIHIEEVMEEMEQQKRATGWPEMLRSPSLSSIFSGGKRKNGRPVAAASFSATAAACISPSLQQLAPSAKEKTPLFYRSGVEESKGKETKEKEAPGLYTKNSGNITQPLTSAASSSTTATAAAAAGAAAVAAAAVAGKAAAEEKERRRDEEALLAVAVVESAAATSEAAAATAEAAAATEAAAAAAERGDAKAAEEAAAATEVAAAATEVAAAATEEAATAAAEVAAATNAAATAKAAATAAAAATRCRLSPTTAGTAAAEGKRNEQEEETLASGKRGEEEEEEGRRIKQGSTARGLIYSDKAGARAPHYCASVALKILNGDKEEKEEKEEESPEGLATTPTLWQQLRSKYSLLMMGNYVSQAVLYPFLSTSAEDLFGKSVNDFLGVALPFSSVACLVFGRLTDLYGIMKVLLSLHTTITVVYLLSLLHNTATSYIAAILLVVYVSFYSSQVYCYVNDTFAAAQFGRIVGMTFMVAGFSSLLKIPLHALVVHVFHSEYTWPVVIMLALCVINFVILAFLWFVKKKNPHPFWPHEAAVAAAVKAPAQHINHQNTPH